MKPQLTAIVPLKHYHEPYLRFALASLRGQGCPRWRGLVVVERADLVRFRALLADELSDPRLDLVANEGLRLAGAINTGIRLATTPFVAILLADDAWEPHAVEVLERHILEHRDVEFFHAGRSFIDDEGRPHGRPQRARHPVDVTRFPWGAQVKHLMCFERRKALAVGALDERIRSVGPDDYDFPWTMADRGARFLAIDDLLYVYRDHRRTYRLTTHLPLSVHTRELVRILRKHGVPWAVTLGRVRAARRGYLRQCLYRNGLHRWLCERLGLEPRVWRQDYS